MIDESPKGGSGLAWVHFTTTALSTSYVSIREIADRIGIDRSNTLKAVKKAGFTPIKKRTPDSNNQPAACLSMSDAEMFIALREQAGHVPGKKRIVDAGSTANDVGEFYVIELVPGYTGDIKFGFSESARRRLMEHRTAAPRCVIRRSFPCLRGWERTAIARITRSDCQQVGPEAFVFDSVELAIARAEAFFNLMPHVSYRPELAADSPLNT